jgi:hypothetical protein
VEDEMHDHHGDHSHEHHHSDGSYGRLAVELIADFVIIYLVMYTMIATIDHFKFDLNNYMTLIMVAPVSAIMLPGRARW